MRGKSLAELGTVAGSNKETLTSVYTKDSRVRYTVDWLLAMSF